MQLIELMSNIDEIINRLNNLNLQANNLSPSTDSTSQSEEVIRLINQALNNTETESSAAGITESIITNNSQQTSLNSNTVIMATSFKPEYLNCVPHFDGNPNDLNRYLSVCQSLIDTFYKANEPHNFQNVYLLNCIIGKLTGNAKLVLGTQNVNTWEELKLILGRHFADQRDEACLNRDLVMLRQNNNESPNQYYDRILHILNLLCSYVDLHETDDNAKILKRTLYNNLALKTFLSGLKEPLGTTIRCMRPKDLPEALQFVMQENNTHYFQSTPKILNQPKTPNFNTTAQYTHQSKTQNFNTPGQYTHYQNRNAFPSQPISVRPNYNKTQQKFPTNSQVFGKKPQVNVFKSDPNKPLPKPTPMSTTSHNTLPKSYQYQNSNQPRYNYFQSRSNQPPNFTFEELHNTDTVDDPNSYLLYQTNNEETYTENYDQPEYSAYYPQYDDTQSANQVSNNLIDLNDEVQTPESTQDFRNTGLQNQGT